MTTVGGMKMSVRLSAGVQKGTFQVERTFCTRTRGAGRLQGVCVDKRFHLVRRKCMRIYWGGLWASSTWLILGV